MAIRKSSSSGTPKGTTAQRSDIFPSPQIGDVYNNGTLGVEEIYTSSGWVAKSAPAAIPINVVATNQGSGRAFNNGQASVAFSNGEGGGLSVDFIVTPSPTTSPATFTGSSSPVTVTGLQSSQQYTYTVQARNNFGTSLASAASAGVTATTIPQAPTIGNATGGNAQAEVTFTANATGGSAITSYTVISSPGNITASGSSSPITVTGLTNGTAYTFTVTATNANGTSTSSSASNSVTPISTFTADYLVVAGGGGGGQMGGGGGAGGLRSTVDSTGGGGSLESQLTLNLGNSYTVTVGAGGPGDGSHNTNASPGANSVISGSGITTITSLGGTGGAGYNSTVAATGGSGGGGSRGWPTIGASVPGTGTFGQGYNGGIGRAPNSPSQDQFSMGGGGGGAGQQGGDATNSTSGPAGNGGNGVSVSISGSSIAYAGGGGGGAYQPAAGTGGSGGGGNGANGGNSPQNGTANRGGGAGGGGTGANGGNGGSGIVIIRYPSARTISVGAGLTSSTSTVGGNKVTTFTAGTGTVSFS